MHVSLIRKKKSLTMIVIIEIKGLKIVYFNFNWGWVKLNGIITLTNNMRDFLENLEGLLGKIK